MKRSLILILLLIVLDSQTTAAQTRTLRDSLFERSVVADRKWSPFFKRLRAVVKRRDRARLKEMMIPEFHYSLGHHAKKSERRLS